MFVHIYIYRSMRHYDDLSRPHDPDVIQQRPYLSWVGDFWQLTCVCVCVYIYIYVYVSKYGHLIYLPIYNFFLHIYM